MDKEEDLKALIIYPFLALIIIIIINTFYKVIYKLIYFIPFNTL